MVIGYQSDGEEETGNRLNQNPAYACKKFTNIFKRLKIVTVGFLQARLPLSNHNT